MSLSPVEEASAVRLTRENTCDMFLCMRTTINIHDGLLRRAKQRAHESHRTLTAVIEDALRMMLNQKQPSQKKGRIRIPTTGSGGLLPGVDLNDTSSLLDRMDDAYAQAIAARRLKLGG